MNNRIVRVLNFPSEKSLLLLLRLEDQHRDGGKVELNEGIGYVDVEFECEHDAQCLLNFGNIEVDGQTFKVAPVCNITSLQVTGITPEILEIDLLLFLENKADTDDVQMINFDSAEGYATCSLTTSKEAIEILENGLHEFNKSRIKFLQIPNDLADFKEMSCGIKVRMSSMLSEKELKIIFGRYGHVIDELYVDEARKTAVFTYQTPKGAQQHLDIRSYCNVSFEVDRMIPKFSPSVGEGDEFLNEKFIVSNLPLMFDNESLVYYFNNNLKTDDTTKILYARSNPGSVLVVFKTPKKFCLLQRLVFSKPFYDKMLKLEHVEKPRSVHLSGVQGISNEQLSNYFEKKRYQVESIFLWDDYAIVKFNNASSLNEIVSEGNIDIHEKRLNVLIHYEKLGIVHQEEASMNSKCWLQKCASIECNSSVVNFLLKSDNDRSLIDRSLETNCGVIDWPKNLFDEDKTIELKMKFVSSPLLDVQRLKMWDQNCISTAIMMMQKFNFYKLNLLNEMGSSVLNHIFEKVGGVGATIQNEEMRMCGDVLIHLKGNLLVISGLISKVKKVKNLIDAIYMEESQRFQRELSKVTCEIQLKCVKGDYLEKETNLLDSYKVDKMFNNQKTVLTLKGLPDDVNEATMKINEFLSNTVLKMFTCDGFIVELLIKPEIVNHIEEIFSKNGVKAAFSVDANKLCICALTYSKANEAFEIMQTELIEHSIILDKFTRETLSQSEWNEKMMKIFEQKHKLMIKLINNDTLSVCGEKNEVQEATEMIHSYFDAHAIYHIEIKSSRGKCTFFKRHLNIELINLFKKANVVGKFLSDQGRFKIEGLKSNVELVEKEIIDLLDKIQVFKRIIAESGFRKYIVSELGKIALQSISLNTKTHIEISDSANDFEDQKVSGNMKCTSICLKDHVILNVTLGSILVSDADVIVNAANKRLDHIGGIASVISKAAGPEFQKECTEYVKKNGEVEVGKVYVSSPGSLKFKAVVNVVGPMYMKRTDAEAKLYEAVKNVLKVADVHGWDRIALPAISTGVYGFPIDLASKITLQCVKDYTGILKHLKTIEIVDINPDVIKEFQKSIKEMFCEKKILFYKEVSSSMKKIASSKSLTSNPKVKRVEQQKKGIGLSNSNYPPMKFVKGCLIDQSVDVIVNSASSNLDLNNGVIANLISKNAGPEMQKACDAHIKQNGNINCGDVFVTHGFSLPCKFVFHGVCAAWSSPIKSEESIRLLTRKSLEEASKRKLKSIAMPSFGTGRLNVPGRLVIKWMYEETNAFFSHHPDSSLTDLRLVVYEKDYKVIREFEEFLNGAVESVDVERKLLKTHKRDLENERGFIVKILNLNVELCLGDLTEEKTEAIVNSTNASLDFTKGAISRAIIEKGGNAIWDECKNLKNFDIIHVTSSGNLACKYVFHVNLDKELKTVEACLSKAEQLQLSSLSFPLLMTGQHKKNIASVTQKMFELFEMFATKEPQHLRNVRVVINNKDKFKQVQESLSEPEGAFKRFLKTYFRSEKSYSLQEYYTPKSVPTLCIYAFSESDANKAESKLKESMSESMKSYEIGDPWKEVIGKLSENEESEIMNYENIEDVNIIIDKMNKKITISGITPSKAHVEIINLLREAATELEEAKSISEKAQWYYKDKDYRKYILEINLIIEKAFRDNKQSVKWTEMDGNVEIDFAAMTECCSWKPLVKHPVKRVISEDIFPLHWDFTNEKIIVCNVIPGSKEYSTIKNDISQTSGNTVNSIEKITRIQNATLYKQYIIKKESLTMEHANKAIRIERALWHSATNSTIDEIKTHGFNRFKDVKPSNAAQLGQASYFFNSFCDVHQGNPDTDGLRHAYRCLVLTGRYANGTPTSRDVPFDTDGRCDSSVDDSNNPTTFAIFNDCQAYPEYLIYYK